MGFTHTLDNWGGSANLWEVSNCKEWWGADILQMVV